TVGALRRDVAAGRRRQLGGLAGVVAGVVLEELAVRELAELERHHRVGDVVDDLDRARLRGLAREQRQRAADRRERREQIGRLARHAEYHRRAVREAGRVDARGVDAVLALD